MGTDLPHSIVHPQDPSHSKDLVEYYVFVGHRLFRWILFQNWCDGSATQGTTPFTSPLLTAYPLPLARYWTRKGPGSVEKQQPHCEGGAAEKLNPERTLRKCTQSHVWNRQWLSNMRAECRSGWDLWRSRSGWVGSQCRVAQWEALTEPPLEICKFLFDWI